jgi:hypothetical protein
VQACLSAALAIGALCSAAPAHAADKPDAKGAKMSLYIRMINAWVNKVDDQRTRYFQTVDKQTGITCKEKNLRMLQVAPIGAAGEDLSVKDLPKFRDALKKGPKLDTDVAAKQMIDSVALIFAVDNNYFYNSKFLGDDCKRGKEINAMLLETWPKFFKAQQEVRAAVEKYTDEQELVKLLEAEKKFGKGSFHWYERKLLLDAKTLIKAVDVAAREPLGDPAPLHTAAAALQKTHDELKPLLQKFAARDDAGDTSDWGYLTYHASELARETESRAKRMDDEVKKQKINPYAKNEIEKLIKSYNDMVGAANRLTFSKSMK